LFARMDSSSSKGVWTHLREFGGRLQGRDQKETLNYPGMDVNSGDLEGRDNRPGLIVKKSRPAYRPEGSSVVAGELVGERQTSGPNKRRGGSTRLFSRRPKKDCWQHPTDRREAGGGAALSGRKQAGAGGHPPQRKQHCSPPPEKQKIGESRRKIHASWSNDKGRRRKLGTEPYDAEVSRTVP
jgi:hypothetical protein